MLKTAQEINKAIAEYCGWHLSDEGWINPEGKLRPDEAVPDFCNDLNALRDAETFLCEHNYRHRDEYARRIFGCFPFNGVFTSAQERAETFVKTICG